MRRLLGRGAREWIIALGIVAAAAMVVFWWSMPRPIIPTVFAGGFDSFLLMAPHLILMDTAIQSGEIPLWNPLTCCGMPQAAHGVSGVFYPLNLARSLLTFNPTPLNTLLGMTLLNLGHLILAGAGAFMLARTHRVGRGGATVAALTFVLSAVFIRWALEIWTSVAIVAWLPILLLLMKRGMDSPRVRVALINALIMGLILGSCLMSLYPQFFIILCVCVAAYGAAYWLVFARRREARQSVASTTRMVRIAVLMIIPFAVAPPLAMVHLLPGFEYAEYTSRTKDVDLEHSPDFLDRSPLAMIEHYVAYPGSYGVEARRAAGAGVWLLALASVFTARRRHWVVWVAMFFVLLDCTIGPPMPIASLVDMMAPFRMRFPSRITIFLCLPLGILAGMGVDAVSGSRAAAGSAVVRVGLFVCATAVIGALLVHWARGQAWLPVPKVALAAPIALGAVLAVSPWIRGGRMKAVALLGLLFVEIFAWNREFVPYLCTRVHLDEYGVTAESLARPVTLWQTNGRGTELLPNYQVLTLSPAINGTDAMLVERVRQVMCAPENEHVYSHWVHAEEVTAANQRGNLFLKRGFWLARQYVRGQLPPKDELFPPTTTVFLPDPPPLTVPEVVRESVAKSSVSDSFDEITLGAVAGEAGDGHEAYTIAFPPRAEDGHAALLLTCVASETATLKTSFIGVDTSRRELGKTYVLDSASSAQTVEIPLPAMEVSRAEVEVKPGGLPAVRIEHAALRVDLADENALITDIRRTLTGVTLRVGPLEGPRILVFVDAAYPGWQARIDGVDVPVFKAQDAFKAIEVPAGTHEVAFEFKSQSFATGAAVSLVSFALVLAGLIVVGYRFKGGTSTSANTA